MRFILFFNHEMDAILIVIVVGQPAVLETALEGPRNFRPCRASRFTQVKNAKKMLPHFAPKCSAEEQVSTVYDNLINFCIAPYVSCRSCSSLHLGFGLRGGLHPDIHLRRLIDAYGVMNCARKKSRVHRVLARRYLLRPRQ
jgi:hypothetical protein